eukprot:5805510-Pyramimonas_sp.AAC.1
MAVLQATGAALRMRARGLRATTIEASAGIRRRLLHVVEAELDRLAMPLVFARLLHEALFAASALTFCNGASACNALFGRQPSMLPDLSVLEREQQMGASDISREQTILGVSVEAASQATAVAKTS